jgi:2'-5' RNA ligase
VIRVFVAVELDRDIKDAIAQVQGQVRDRIGRYEASRARIQWVHSDSIHLTLKFLGDIAEPRVDEIRQALALQLSRLPRFSVDMGGLGVFPGLRAPRVLWMGLSAQQARPGDCDQADFLGHLAAEIEAALDKLGCPRETRPFSPHLTLARIKERSREVGRALEASGAMTLGSRLGSLAVDAVALMKSDLKPSGAVYTKLWELPLKR